MSSVKIWFRQMRVTPVHHVIACWYFKKYSTICYRLEPVYTFSVKDVILSNRLSTSLALMNSSV